MVFVADYRKILVGIVVGLLVGAGAGYFYGQSLIAGYIEEVDKLETESLELRIQLEKLRGEFTGLQDQLDLVMANLTITRSSLKDLQRELSETTADYEALQLLYSTLEQEYTSLELSYEAVKEDYDKLRESIPPRVGILYSEMKKAPEGYVKNDLVGVCGQDYLLPAPFSSDVWEVNITIISELSWQSVHITIYKVIEDYPPDFLGQPFAPYARGEGEASMRARDVLKLHHEYLRKSEDRTTLE